MGDELIRSAPVPLRPLTINAAQREYIQTTVCGEDLFIVNQPVSSFSWKAKAEADLPGATYGEVVGKSPVHPGCRPRQRSAPRCGATRGTRLRLKKLHRPRRPVCSLSEKGVERPAAISTSRVPQMDRLGVCQANHGGPSGIGFQCATPRRDAADAPPPSAFQACKGVLPHLPYNARRGQNTLALRRGRFR